MKFGRLCIIGVGLMGGSLARALRNRGLCDSVVGCSRNVEHLQRAQKLGVIDEYETDIAKAVQDADIVVVAVPLGSMPAIFQRLNGHVRKDAVITDVGSAKASVVEAARTYLKAHLPQFVPGHPIAGTEKSGVEASFAELYQGRRVIITPLPENDPDAVERVQDMWIQTGATVQSMSVEHHDEVLAATSHLPHILAYALVDTLARMSDRDEIFQYAAGGFRDFTRIASSDPVMWKDICLSNREAILSILDRYKTDLDLLRSYIEHIDADKLESVFRSAKDARDRYTDEQR